MNPPTVSGDRVALIRLRGLMREPRFMGRTAAEDGIKSKQLKFVMTLDEHLQAKLAERGPIAVQHFVERALGQKNVVIALPLSDGRRATAHDYEITIMDDALLRFRDILEAWQPPSAPTPGR